MTSPKSSLPEWYFKRNWDIYDKASVLEQAFEIAWEALMKMHYAPAHGEATVEDCAESAREAMRRIEEIGK